MGAFKIKKNGTVYENNKMPGAYPGERVTYDNTESGLTANNAQGAIDEVVEIKANKTDLTSISQNEPTATQAISSGTYFYLDGVLVRAKTAIASGATFTLNTNYEVVTAGALNSKANILTNQNYNYVDGTVFGGSIFSALESANGSTRYRLVLGNDGSVSRFKSTDGGATWGSQTIIL